MHASTSPLLVVMTRGGTVSEVLSTGAVAATVIDYDTDGVNDLDTVAIPQGNGTSAPALIRLQANTDQPDRVAHLVAVLPPEDREEAIAEPDRPVRALIIMEGGVVQNVVTDHPLRLIEVEYDLDGLDETAESDLRAIPQDTGAPRSGLADWTSPEVNPDEVDRLWPLLHTEPNLAPTPRRPRLGR
jgi:hypothetical protein